jgi:hypothetical protein
MKTRGFVCAPVIDLSRNFEIFVSSNRQKWTNIKPCIKSETSEGLLSLLNRGSKCDLRYGYKNWVQNLVLEAETEIHYLPIREYDYTEKLNC